MLNLLLRQPAALLRQPAALLRFSSVAAPTGSSHFAKFLDLTASNAAAAATALELEEAKQQLMVDKVKASNAKNPGVAVVKTIVKQSRAKMKKTMTEKGLGNVQVTKTTPADLAPDNETDPFYWLELAASSGHSEALVRLGNHHLNLANAASAPSPSNLALAIEKYALSGVTEGYFNLGNIYYSGNPLCELPVDMKKAMHWFGKAADEGDCDAMYFLGVAMEDLEMVRRAAENGHGGAMHYMALHGYNDLSVEEGERLARFRREIEAAATEGGDCDAMAVLADCYFKGDDGFDVDHSAALKWWLKAGEEGDNADAAVSAGALLFAGSPEFNIEQNRSYAFTMYQRGGELGSVDGWRNVAACYELGEGVPECKKSAQYIVDTIIKGASETSLAAAPGAGAPLAKGWAAAPK